jgi:hypothetical protein
MNPIVDMEHISIGFIFGFILLMIKGNIEYCTRSGNIIAKIKLKMGEKL